MKKDEGYLIYSTTYKVSYCSREKAIESAKRAAEEHPDLIYYVLKASSVAKIQAIAPVSVSMTDIADDDP